jgi:hypothetical protein
MRREKTRQVSSQARCKSNSVPRTGLANGDEGLLWLSAFSLSYLDRLQLPISNTPDACAHFSTPVTTGNWLCRCSLQVMDLSSHATADCAV